MENVHLQTKSNKMTEFRNFVRSLIDQVDMQSPPPVSVSTLGRWANGTSIPRPEKVQSVIQSLPSELGEQLWQIAEQIWPSLSVPGNSAQLVSSIIPSAFYAKVVSTYGQTPTDLLYDSLCSIVLLQALQQLDPRRIGMQLVVVHCLPPTQHHKVRALYTRASMKLPKLLKRQLYLHGAESLAGRAIASFQPALATSYAIFENTSPGNAAAVPIFRAGQVGGGLLALMPQEGEGYFTEAVCSLLMDYAGLLALALPPEDFFEKSQIELGVFPPATEQRELQSLEERTLTLIRSSLAENQEKGLTRQQAEMLALQEIVEQLLHIS